MHTFNSSIRLSVVVILLFVARPIAATVSERLSSGLPRTVLHDVPFTPQAPYANWKQPYQDACEEAAVVIAAAWARGQTLTPQIADRKIRRLVAFQNIHYGDYRDTNAKETAQLARDYYKLNVRVAYDINHEDIRDELANGNIVIAPMAGQLLKNPYYTPPGPAYHMLIFIGYDDATQEFIVNDPGTRRGKHYRYSYATIDRALHDWIGSKDTITKARSAMIVVSRPSHVE